MLHSVSINLPWLQEQDREGGSAPAEVKVIESEVQQSRGLRVTAVTSGATVNLPLRWRSRLQCVMSHCCVLETQQSSSVRLAVCGKGNCYSQLLVEGNFHKLMS